MTINIPAQVWRSEDYKKLADYHRKGLDTADIAELMDCSEKMVCRKLDDIGLYGSKFSYWTDDKFVRLFELMSKELNVAEVAKLLKAPEHSVATAIRHVRNKLVHEPNDFLLLNVTEQVAKHIHHLYATDVAELGISAKKVTVPKKQRPKSLINRYNIQTKRYVMDEWFNFGILEKTTQGAYQLLLSSADGYSATLPKQYTKNWKDILLKAKGLQGEHIAVRMVQNFDNTEPRLVDITASEGIMELAKPFSEVAAKRPGTQPVKKSRYEWIRFGEFEAKVVEGNVLIGNATNDIMIYERGSLHENLEVRLLNMLEAYEHQSILVCIDNKRRQFEGGPLRQFIDAHPEELGLESYTEDYNAILETIASTQDAAAKKGKELEEQHQLLEAQAQELERKHRHEMSKVVDQQSVITNEIQHMRQAVEVELKGYREQEGFLSETKDSLKDYQIGLLAEARDKAGEATTVEMRGMRVVTDDRYDRFVAAMDDGELKDAMIALRDAGQKARRRQSIMGPIQKAVADAEPSNKKDESPFSNTSDALYDEKQEEAMPAWAKQLFEKVDTSLSQGAAVLSTMSMSQAELEDLRVFVKEEEEELEAGNKKAQAERDDILARLNDIVGQTIDCKVYNGHAKNTFLLRQNINLFEQKAGDRVHAQFLKHLHGKVFKVFLPHYNKEAMISIVRDSADANEIAIKNCMNFRGEAWKEAEAEITGFAGKRIVGKKATPANLLKWHNAINETIGV